MSVFFRSVQMCVVAYLVILAHVGIASAAPASYDVAVRFDPVNAEVRVSVEISGATGPMNFDRTDWVTLDELHIGGELIEPDQSPLLLSADETAGREIVFSLSGELPTAPEEPGRFGAFPTGAFLFGADGWVPGAEDGSAVYTVTLEVPDTHRSMATGALESEEIRDGAYIATFNFEGTADDLAIFFGPYVIGERYLGDIRLRTYFLERHAKESDAYLEAVAVYLDQYENVIGDYPHEGFSVVSAPIPVGYGLDTMTYVSENILAHPYMRGRSLAHEILHSWWGSGVRIDYDSGNWGEGLTTFQADYALAEERGPESAREMRREWLQRLSVLPAALDAPARSFRSSAHGAGQAIGYSKVAMLFQMLRQELGDAVFESAIKAFWEANLGKTASWPGLRAAFESSSGRDLGWFFAQWLDRPGLPMLTIDEVSITDSGSHHTVSVSIAQSAPPYRLIVPIAIETETGTSKLAIQLEDLEGEATFDVPSRPIAVQIDPDFEVARRLPRSELPPSFREALWTADMVMTAPADGSYAEAAGVLADRLAPKARIVDPAEVDRDAGTMLIIGATDEVIARRNASIGGEEPAVAAAGTSRAWVERDEQERLWLFMSADSSADVDVLYALKYYGSLSYAAFKDGSAFDTGTWPVDSNPLRVTLDR